LSRSYTGGNEVPVCHCPDDELGAETKPSLYELVGTSYQWNSSGNWLSLCRAVGATAFETNLGVNVARIKHPTLFVMCGERGGMLWALGSIAGVNAGQFNWHAPPIDTYNFLFVDGHVAYLKPKFTGMNTPEYEMIRN
jgi:prepilin-type processing-associated H-X9-DG protein